MATPKRKPKPQPPPPKTADGRSVVIAIKGTVEFRDWLAGLADHERLTGVQLVERALVEYAERRSYPKPAPRRTERRSGA